MTITEANHVNTLARALLVTPNRHDERPVGEGEVREALAFLLGRAYKALGAGLPPGAAHALHVTRTGVPQ